MAKLTDDQIWGTGIKLRFTGIPRVDSDTVDYLLARISTLEAELEQVRRELEEKSEEAATARFDLEESLRRR